MPSIPIFEESQMRAVVTPALAVSTMRDAFRADGEGRTTVPAVINLQVPGGGEFHVKTAFIDGVPHIAVKIGTGAAANVDRGLPAGSGMIAVFDGGTGLPAARATGLFRRVQPAFGFPAPFPDPGKFAG